VTDRIHVSISVIHGGRGGPIQRIETWLHQHAPWFVGEERDRLVEAACALRLK
jgi:hypothetical protein